ncbi:MAG: hypothetical protein Tsb0016_18220 [Sphingomonadales bacterium]
MHKKVLLALGSAALLAACSATGNQAALETPNSEALAYDAVMAQDWATAETHLRQSIAEQPEEPMLLLNLAYVLSSTGRQAEAIALYEKVMAMDSNPMVAVSDGTGRRAKAIAKQSMASLQGGQ